MFGMGTGGSSMLSPPQWIYILPRFLATLLLHISRKAEYILFSFRLKTDSCIVNSKFLKASCDLL